MATNRPRYTVSVDNELFEQIENFRFEHRFNTRSEATVELIRMGLKALEEEQKKILLIINKPNCRALYFSNLPKIQGSIFMPSYPFQYLFPASHIEMSRI